MTDYKRDPDDFFPTSGDCTEGFLLAERLYIPKNIWECACGDGAISKRLEHRGHQVHSTDLIYRGGYGRGGVDFLMETKMPEVQGIITNPPFRLLSAFMNKCLDFNPHYIALFHRTTVLNTGFYAEVCRRRKPARVHILSWRPDIFGLGSPDQRCLFAWTVWDGDATKTDFLLMNEPASVPVTETQAMVLTRLLNTRALVA